jgi:hypothetical protein
LLGLVCALFSSAGLAQGTNATLNGIVNDPGGAVISGAQIQIQNINTGVKETVVSNASGVYSASQLPPGQYTVAVQKTGFQKSIQTGVVLAVVGHEKALFSGHLPV